MDARGAASTGTLLAQIACRGACLLPAVGFVSSVDSVDSVDCGFKQVLESESVSYAQAPASSAQLPWSVFRPTHDDCIMEEELCFCEMRERLIEHPSGRHLRLHGLESHEGIAIFPYAGIRLSTRAQRGAPVQASLDATKPAAAGSRHMHV
ncbi:hypothetical protein EKO04_010966 [Ascochyta lentis]|uniref:Uncharacterized protein n=1 Tax=Ascochyta lentis TaxID=205686 RepID=A0A8H7ISV5_9PLEO|nr:hypothetical protein EKO04_010966 [Ascochyta lentis]